MKVSFRLRSLLLVWVSLCIVGEACAQESFKVAVVRLAFSSDLIKVGKDWRKDLPKRIQATLQVQTDTPGASMFVHAYFYDKENHLIGTDKRPNPVWTSTPKGLQEIDIPAILSTTHPNDVYFALPEDLQTKKWTTVVVVFGNDNKVSVAAMPPSDLSKLDFPEKEKLAPAH